VHDHDGAHAWQPAVGERRVHRPVHSGPVDDARPLALGPFLGGNGTPSGWGGNPAAGAARSSSAGGADVSAGSARAAGRGARHRLPTRPQPAPGRGAPTGRELTDAEPWS
jgi:hypothetical protein